MTTHHSRKSRKSRLRKCPSMGRQRVGDSIGKAPPVRDVRRNTREGHLAPPADYQHVVSVRIQTLRHVGGQQDRKSTRLNSSHTVISYAVFCLKKKKNIKQHKTTSHKILKAHQFEFQILPKESGQDRLSCVAGAVSDWNEEETLALIRLHIILQ